jgi:hypothetical protein
MDTDVRNSDVFDHTLYSCLCNGYPKWVSAIIDQLSNPLVSSEHKPGAASTLVEKAHFNGKDGLQELSTCDDPKHTQEALSNCKHLSPIKIPGFNPHYLTVTGKLYTAQDLN